MRSSRARAATGLVLVALTLPAVAACSKSEDTSTTASSTTAPTSSSESTTTKAGGPVNAGASATIKEFAFEPNEIKVKANELVTWKNDGSAKHTVTASDGQAVSFKSPTMQPGDQFSFTFPAAGTYTYFCSVHGKDKMSGTVLVEP